MKRFICVVLLLACVCLLSGCEKEEIVGQWVYESGSTYLLIYPNGDIFEVGINGIGEYITGVNILEDGSYKTFYSWYKNDAGDYVIVNSLYESVVHIEEDALWYDGDIYEWYRLSGVEKLSEKEIYYSTFDKENMAYVFHPLSELIK